MKRSALKRGKPLQRKARLRARKVPKAFRKRRDPAYQAWVRTQLCLLAGSKVTPTGLVAGRYFISPTISYWHSCAGPVQSCHVKSRGAGGDDRANLWPGCYAAHEQQHLVGIRSFQARWGIDLKAEAERLYQQYLTEIVP